MTQLQNILVEIMLEGEDSRSLVAMGQAEKKEIQQRLMELFVEDDKYHAFKKETIKAFQNRTSEVDENTPEAENAFWEAANRLSEILREGGEELPEVISDTGRDHLLRNDERQPLLSGNVSDAGETDGSVKAPLDEPSIRSNSSFSAASTLMTLTRGLTTQVINTVSNKVGEVASRTITRGRKSDDSRGDRIV